MARYKLSASRPSSPSPVDKARRKYAGEKNDEEFINSITYGLYQTNGVEAIHAMLEYLRYKVTSSSNAGHDAGPSIENQVSGCDAARSKFIEMGCNFKLVRILSSSIDVDLKLEIAQILSILAEGTDHHLKAVLDADALPALMCLLSSLDAAEFEDAEVIQRGTAKGTVASLIDILTKAQQALDTKSSLSESHQKGMGRLEDLPLDVVELTLSKLSVMAEDGVGKGGLNIASLVSKPFMQVVKSVATRLTRLTNEGKGPVLLPFASLTRFRNIEHISCSGLNLWSLEGCSDGLKSLTLYDRTNHLKSLEPLSACTELESFVMKHPRHRLDVSPLSFCTKLKTLVLVSFGIRLSDLSHFSSLTSLEELILPESVVTDVSPLSSMSKLEVLDLSAAQIRDISYLSQCKKLNGLNIGDNEDIKDLSPLSQCPDLEELNISHLHLIKDLSFLEKGFAKLRGLNITGLPLDDLSPLTKLQYLELLSCDGILDTTSLLPLAKCAKLKKLQCSEDAKDLDDLRERRPGLEFYTREQWEQNEEEA